MELQRWAMAVRYREAQAQAKVNEVALEVSAANEVNEDEVKSDVNVEAKVEVFGMKEVKNLEDDEEVEMRLPLSKKVMQLGGLTMKKMEEQSRCANWDPGELYDAKALTEMLDVEEAKILVNINKVGLQLFMKEVWSSGGATEKALLIVMFLLRFENGFRRKCPIELSDYG